MDKLEKAICFIKGNIDGINQMKEIYGTDETSKDEHIKLCRKLQDYKIYFLSELLERLTRTEE